MAGGTPATGFIHPSMARDRARAERSLHLRKIESFTNLREQIVEDDPREVLALVDRLASLVLGIPDRSLSIQAGGDGV